MVFGSLIPGIKQLRKQLNYRGTKARPKLFIELVLSLTAKKRAFLLNSGLGRDVTQGKSRSNRNAVIHLSRNVLSNVTSKVR